jgi:hypothetical protein
LAASLTRILPIYSLEDSLHDEVADEKPSKENRAINPKVREHLPPEVVALPSK